MTGHSMVKVPTWQSKNAIAAPAMARRHVNWLFSKTYPDDHYVPGENWDPTRGYDDGMGSGGYTDMNPQNSWWEWDLGLLKAGTWRISLWSVKGPERGIATFKMNDVTVATIDLYAAANDYPGTYSFADFVIASDRDVVWLITNPTKRAAATGYQVTIRIMSLDRISA